MFKINYEDNLNLNYNNSLLIVIDMIKGFTDIGNLKSHYIKNIAVKIRDYSYNFSNIVAINDKHEIGDIEFDNYPIHCIRDSEEVEFCEELLNIKFNNILFKNSTNGFFAEGFLDTIKKYIDNNFDFVVCGCCSDICILQFCLTFKSYLCSINKRNNIVVPTNLIETYDSGVHPRQNSVNASLYLMKNSGVRLIK